MFVVYLRHLKEDKVMRIAEFADKESANLKAIELNNDSRLYVAYVSEESEIKS